MQVKGVSAEQSVVLNDSSSISSWLIIVPHTSKSTISNIYRIQRTIWLESCCCTCCYPPVHLIKLVKLSVHIINVYHLLYIWCAAQHCRQSSTRPVLTWINVQKKTNYCRVYREKRTFFLSLSSISLEAFIRYTLLLSLLINAQVNQSKCNYTSATSQQQHKKYIKKI